MLSGLKEVESTEITTQPLCFVDTAGSGLFETLVGVSRGNRGLNYLLFFSFFSVDPVPNLVLENDPT